MCGGRWWWLSNMFWTELPQRRTLSDRIKQVILMTIQAAISRQVQRYRSVWRGRSQNAGDIADTLGSEIRALQHRKVDNHLSPHLKGLTFAVVLVAATGGGRRRCYRLRHCFLLLLWMMLYFCPLGLFIPPSYIYMYILLFLYVGSLDVWCACVCVWMLRKLGTTDSLCLGGFPSYNPTHHHLIM